MSKTPPQPYPCLVQEVYKLLVNAGHPRASVWLDQPAVREMLGKDGIRQRMLINRYWRIKVGLLETDTSMPRYCLFDDGKDSDWLNIFKDALVPLIVQYDLV